MKLRTFHWLSFAGTTLLVAFACTSRQAAPQSESPVRLVATIKDLMDSEVDPSADLLWDSVATIVTKQGTEEKRPRTDEDWTKVRRSAVTLVEATNLLVLDGRKVARPGQKADNPDVELGPEEIEAVINQDRQAFVKFAHGLQDASLEALKAIDAKNAEGLLDAGEKIDEACEQCHLKYWYPLSKQAETAAKSQKAQKSQP